ncbi:MAG TPA: hypothetical protein DCM45_01750 [Clostridiales bacterium]|nr:hypothetical protein [Clostridiales bacterium]
MSRVSQAIGRVFSGGAKAFARYPAAMFSAMIVAIAATALTALDLPSDERLFTNMMLAFAASALWGLAVAVACGYCIGKQLPFVLINIITLLAGSGLFAYLYLLPDRTVPMIIMARIIASGLAAFIMFLLVISADAGRSDYNQAAFMTLKSFLIAALYTIVILLGLFFVAFTVQSLIYEDLSEKVFSYIAIWSLFLGFAFFLGYFPRFRRNEKDNRLDIAQKHPAFAEILFAYVLVPIMFILTVVMLIWAVQILIVGNWQEFELLASIFTAYSMFGVFLSIMISHYTQHIATFYRRIFPFSALVFLLFEAYAIYRQVAADGIKSSEYFICLFWLFALLAVLVLFSGKPVRNRLMAWIALVLTVLSVLPFTGYQSVSVYSQTERLRVVLAKNDMIVDGAIVSAPASISLADKIVITDAATFLMGNEYKNQVSAVWLSEKIKSGVTFKSIFGFSETYSEYNPEENVTREIYLNLKSSAVEITGYDYAAVIAGDFEQPVEFNGANGTYRVRFRNMNDARTPSIEVSRNDQVIISQDFSMMIEGLIMKYEGQGEKNVTDVADMTASFEVEGVRLMVVFQSMSIMIDVDGSFRTYMYPAAVYLGE